MTSRAPVDPSVGGIAGSRTIPPPDAATPPRFLSWLTVPEVMRRGGKGWQAILDRSCRRA